MVTKLNPGVIAEGSITADKINIESLKTDSGVVTEDSLANKINGKGLSTEDFTTELKTKLEGLSNFDDTELSSALSTLRSDFDKLVSGDTTTAIKTFNEVIAFLDGLTDTQDLESIIASIEQQIAGKMDNITLATVATSGSYNDLSNKPTIPAAVTESNVSGWGFTKNTGTITQIKANGTSVATSGVANIPAASTSAYGVTKLSSATNSTSTTLAATASAVKSVYDLANGKQDKLVSGTNIKTINGESILGSGDIAISGGGSGAYAEINHGTSDTTFTLTPNTFHIWDEVSDLTITFEEGNEGCTNEYLFQFSSGEWATMLSLPSNVKWADPIKVESYKIYQISIINNLATVLSWKNVPMISFRIIPPGNTMMQAEQGMTWYDWVNSSYNTLGCTIQGNHIIHYGMPLSIDGMTALTPEEVIIDGAVYCQQQ